MLNITGIGIYQTMWVVWLDLDKHLPAEGGMKEEEMVAIVGEVVDDVWGMTNQIIKLNINHKAGTSTGIVERDCFLCSIYCDKRFIWIGLTYQCGTHLVIYLMRWCMIK